MHLREEAHDVVDNEWTVGIIQGSVHSRFLRVVYFIEEESGAGHSSVLRVVGQCAGRTVFGVK